MKWFTPLPMFLLLWMCSPQAIPLSDRHSILSSYEPILSKGTLPGTRLEGDLRVADDWAFFLGNTVDATGEAVTPPDGISSDTVILFRRSGEQWQVIDHGLGISDAFYLDWPRRYGAPQALISPAQD